MTPTMTPPAESSPAPAPAPAQAVMPKSGTPEYAEWRMTGNVPEPKAESAPAKENPAEGDKPKEKSAPASEPGDKQERRSSAETRKAELRREIDELLDQRRKLRDEVGTKAEPTKATEQTAKPAVDPKAPVKPKAEDFEGKPWAEYEAAKDKYFEDLADYKADKKVESERQRIRQEAQTKELEVKVADAEKRYGAETRQTIQKTANTIFSDTKVPESIKAMVDDSPVMVDLLYVMGSKAEDLADFMDTAHSNGSAAIRKLVLIEQLVIEELKGKGTAKAETPEKGPDGKFIKQTPEPKTTAAPPPPKEVSGRNSQPPDEMATAVQKNDFRSFKAIEDRRALQKRKGL